MSSSSITIYAFLRPTTTYFFSTRILELSRLDQTYYSCFSGEGGSGGG